MNTAKTVAEDLKPPFVAAIMLDVDEQPGRTDFAPSDEMVSLAPKQPGFLGLETTHDTANRWIAVSYWADEESFKGWQAAGQRHLAEVCGGVDLASVCKFRVSRVDEPLGEKKSQKAELPALPKGRAAGLGAGVLGAFPAIAEVLGYEHVR